MTQLEETLNTGAREPDGDVRKPPDSPTKIRYIHCMELDPDRCYRIIQSRDARFDGSFFTAVTSTGIYCRPICPARTPKKENVRFYRYAAAAEVDGFRPCKRCRPETAPGTPAWNGTSATVTRALRLIGNGFLDEHSVVQLAALLGMGERHLRRLFVKHIGVAPSAIAQSRRAHFAASVLRDTALPLSHVALTAGFGSIRQFNDVFRRVFGETPSYVRECIEKRSAGRRTSSAVRTYSLTLSYRPPYDWETLLEFLRKRAVRGVEVVGECSYRRSMAIDGAIGILTVQPAGRDRHELRVTIEDIGPSSLGKVVHRVRRMFDLDADALAISDHLRQDPRIAPLIDAHPGLRIPVTWDPFEALVRAVVGQQVSVSGAVTIAARLAERFGASVERQDSICRVFPGPAELACADLRAIGMPGARVQTLRTVAQAVLDGRVHLDGYAPAAELYDSLQAIPGIGPWSAQYVALRGTGDPDAFPSSDLGIRKALDALGYSVRRAEREDAIKKLSPWRGYAALYLWNALSTGG